MESPCESLTGFSLLAFFFAFINFSFFLSPLWKRRTVEPPRKYLFYLYSALVNFAKLLHPEGSFSYKSITDFLFPITYTAAL